MTRSCCCCSDLLLLLCSSGSILVALQFGLLPHRVAQDTKQMSNSLGEGAAQVFDHLNLSKWTSNPSIIWTPWSAEEAAGPTLFESHMGATTYRIPSLLWVPPREESASGHLLAFAERRESKFDHGRIAICMRRSSTAGLSWSRERELFTPDSFGLHRETLTIGNPTSVFDAQRGKVLLLFIVQNGEDEEEAIINRTSRGSRWIFISESGDAGASWSRPRNITETVKKPEWTWYATGPGNAIQLATPGPFQGRLVVPCDHVETRRIETRDKNVTSVTLKLTYHSHLILSDDGGASWRIGSISHLPTNECAVAELAGGALLVNSRDWSGLHVRILHWSLNGGSSFYETQASKLREPGQPGVHGAGCEASMISHELSRDKRLLLFSNPDSRKKANLTLKFSLDGGRAWKRVRQLHRGPSAYSSLALLPPQKPGPKGEAVAGENHSAEHRLACLFECGQDKYWERIEFQVMSLQEVIPAEHHPR